MPETTITPRQVNASNHAIDTIRELGGEVRFVPFATRWEYGCTSLDSYNSHPTARFAMEHRLGREFSAAQELPPTLDSVRELSRIADEYDRLGAAAHEVGATGLADHLHGMASIARGDAEWRAGYAVDHEPLSDELVAVAHAVNDVFGMDEPPHKLARAIVAGARAWHATRDAREVVAALESAHVPGEQPADDDCGGCDNGECCGACACCPPGAANVGDELDSYNADQRGYAL